MSVNTELNLREKLTLLGITVACGAVLVNSFREDGAPLAASLAFSGIAFTTTYSLIRWLGNVFMRINLQGLDVSKVRQVKMWVKNDNTRKLLD
jgi:UDP-N-acetylglucosamine--dolichyl-phosphate N-acetylglucosaminephosphotransferase